MVIPIHGEQDWMHALSGLPPFRPGDESVLFLSPHPDDETLAAGGFLASQRERGIPVKLVAITDGEHAYANNSGLAQRRIQEQNEAAATLGILKEEISRLHITDSSVSLYQNALVDRLIPLASDDTHIVAPWPYDFHPDHEACGQAAEEVARRTGARLSFYFFWTWHRGTPALFDNLALQAFSLTAAQQEAKQKAIELYTSQLSHSSGNPILHDIHLWPTRLPFEIFCPA